MMKKSEFYLISFTTCHRGAITSYETFDLLVAALPSGNMLAMEPLDLSCDFYEALLNDRPVLHISTNSPRIFHLIYYLKATTS